MIVQMMTLSDLDFFTAMSNMVKCLNIIFHGQFWSKNGINSCLYEKLKICEYKRSRALFGL